VDVLTRLVKLLLEITTTPRTWILKCDYFYKSTHMIRLSSNDNSTLEPVFNDGVSFDYNVSLLYSQYSVLPDRHK